MGPAPGVAVRPPSRGRIQISAALAVVRAGGTI
jgi:hypothetical protein